MHPQMLMPVSDSTATRMLRRESLEDEEKSSWVEEALAALIPQEAGHLCRIAGELSRPEARDPKLAARKGAAPKFGRIPASRLGTTTGRGGYGSAGLPRPTDGSALGVASRCRNKVKSVRFFTPDKPDYTQRAGPLGGSRQLACHAILHHLHATKRQDLSMNLRKSRTRCSACSHSPSASLVRPDRCPRHALHKSH